MKLADHKEASVSWSRAMSASKILLREFKMTQSGKLVRGDITTDGLTRLARSHLISFELVAEQLRIIPQSHIDAHKVLHAMLGYVPTSKASVTWRT